MSCRRPAGLLVIVFVAGACGAAIDKRPCMKVGTSDPLVVNAAVFRLDIYGAGVTCDGAGVVAGSGAPLMSHTYQRGQSIALDVPPGPHALVLTTYSDATAEHELGRGCTVATLSAGAQICFDITLSALTDLGPQPLDGPSSCTTSPDNCPAGQFCDGTQCVQGCSTTAQCSGTNDAGASTQQCCGGACTDVASSVDNCGGCTMACSTSHIARHCSAGSCDGTCLSGYGDCNSDKRSDGCESPLDTVTNCGACGATCDSANSNGASCVGSGCTYTSCKAGFLDCNKTAPDTNGCECATATTAAEGTAGCCGDGTQCQTKHDNGIGQTFYDCAAYGTHDATEALAACVAKTGDKNKCLQYSCGGAHGTAVYCDSSCTAPCAADCWEYLPPGGSGGNPGRVNTSGYCAGNNDPAWN
jgi:hypothetical protein